MTPSLRCQVKSFSHLNSNWWNCIFNIFTFIFWELQSVWQPGAASPPPRTTHSSDSLSDSTEILILVFLKQVTFINQFFKTNVYLSWDKKPVFWIGYLRVYHGNISILLPPLVEMRAWLFYCCWIPKIWSQHYKVDDDGSWSVEFDIFIADIFWNIL